MFLEDSQIGSYTLIRKLGHGGFGEVWLSETAVGEYFALKLPHRDRVDWKAITQEIGLWTLCGNHPNVLPLVGARNFNGQIVIISEYAPDGSLEDLLREEGKLSELEAIEMTIGILEGLEHLHESGIIHRDLKPANILLNSKIPRLADFGISRIISSDSLSETIAGTFAYMAPECFDGKRNVQTDIWSVGVVLYRMLSGNLPFPQKENTSLIGAIINHEPEELVGGISEELKTILSRILIKNSLKRYQTTNDLLTVLKQLKDQTILQDSINYRDKELPFKSVDEILPKISSYCRNKGEIKVNEDAQEFLRRAFEEIDIQANKKKRGQSDVEPTFDGILLFPENVENVVNTIDNSINEAKSFNYPDEELEGLKILLDNIKGSAENNQKTVIIYLYERILPKLRMQREEYFQEEKAKKRASNMAYIFREISKAATPEGKKAAVKEALKDIKGKN